MALVLPSTVEELNLLQNASEPIAIHGYNKECNQAFENIVVERKFKREISLPNGLENWNISNFDSYLNFEENGIGNNFPEGGSADDRVVPEDGDQRGRCGSISSVSSSMDEKYSVFQSYGVKTTFNTVRMDSGSTCISSDHSYVSSNPTILRGLDPEETYQNLNTFFQEVPEVTNTDTLSSSFSSVPSPGSNDSSFELTVLQSGLKVGSPDSFCDKISRKRTLETYTEDEVFALKQTKREFAPTGDGRYHEIRRKNNIASKNCRKTRKEKQKEMESRVMELETEKESLKVEVQVLEEMIQAHKLRLYAILQKR